MTKAMFASVVILLTTLTVASAVTWQDDEVVMRQIMKGPQICQPVQSIPLCANLGLYQNISFPNLRGHLTPKEANQELSDFTALIDTECSNAIVHLLCSIYAPPCMQDHPDLRYPPCRSLCEYVQDGCAATLQEYFKYTWPPNPNLNCSSYTTVENNHLCFCPPDPSSLRIPHISDKGEPHSYLIKLP